MKSERFQIIATICARTGSKGVPGKNIRILLGKPLLAYTIETALKCSLIDKVVLSTDSDKIAEIGKNYGAEAPFLRPSEMATDFVPKFPAIKHSVAFIEDLNHKRYDIIVDLDPTSPLRNVDDITNCIDLLIKSKADSVITCCEAYRNPYFNMLELNDSGYAHLSKKADKIIYRRQDAPKVYSMNASIYAMWRDLFFEKMTFITDKTKVYLMPEERSIDIDREIDFKLVELLMKERINL